MGNICGRQKHPTECKSAQTDSNNYYNLSSRDLINTRYQNGYFKPNQQKMNSQKSKPENVYLKNSILTDWKHPNRFDINYPKQDNPSSDNNMLAPPYSNECSNSGGKTKYDYPAKINYDGTWPINGAGDNNIYDNNNNYKKHRKHSINNNRNISGKSDIEKSNLNLTDEDVLFDEHNEAIADFEQLSGNISPHVEKSRKSAAHYNSGSSRKSSSVKNVKGKCNRSKPKKVSNQRVKSTNNNSNNFAQHLDDKGGYSTNSVNSQKFHSFTLLDQDCYPIQYTFYVDDNEICSKPFYDRRMVAIAKTCRCRIYFHAKAEENEKSLYYKGKPVRPVTITSPDMACLKRCLGSIDSQFPYFNCKAFLSLSS